MRDLAIARGFFVGPGIQPYLREGLPEMWGEDLLLSGGVCGKWSHIQTQNRTIFDAEYMNHIPDAENLNHIPDAE